MNKKSKIGELVEIAKGKKANDVISSCGDGCHRYIQIGDLRADLVLQYTLDKKGVEVEENDLCIAWDGANAGTIGYGLTGYIGSTIARLRPTKKETTHTPYLGRFLQSKFKELNSAATGATIPHISKNYLENLILPLPSLSEQRRIAVILDKADALRRKRAETLQLLDDFMRSVFLEMFGNPVKNEKGWKALPMTQIFNIRTGKLDSNAAIEDGQYPFFTCSRENFEIDTYAFNCEALILSGNNAAGDYSVKYYKGKFNAYQRTYVLELKNPKNSYHFFKQLLEYKLSEMKQGSRGTNTKYLTISFFERLDLFVPPLDIQVQFEKISTATYTHMKRSNHAQKEMNIFFDSLAQRAFRREL